MQNNMDCHLSRLLRKCPWYLLPSTKISDMTFRVFFIRTSFLATILSICIAKLYCDSKCFKYLNDLSKSLFLMLHIHLGSIACILHRAQLIELLSGAWWSQQTNRREGNGQDYSSYSFCLEVVIWPNLMSLEQEWIILL